MEAQNPYQPPMVALDAARSVIGHGMLFAPSSIKVVVMSLCTFGLYPTYWFYRNWRAIKIQDRDDIWPVWRAIFSPLWAYSCFSAIKEIAEKPRGMGAMSAGWLAIAYFLLNVISRLPDPYWIFSLLAFVPLLPVNSLIRNHNRSGGLDHKADDAFTVWNWLGIIVGGLFLLLVLVGLTLGDDPALQ